METRSPEATEENERSEKRAGEQSAEEPAGFDVSQLEESARQAEKRTADHVSAIEEFTPEEIIKEVKERLEVVTHLETIRREREILVQALKEAGAHFEQEKSEPTEDRLREKADYQGNWGELLKSRMEHPLGYVKFALRKLTHLESLKPGEASGLQKKTDFQSHAIEQIREYDRVLEKVFFATEVFPGGHEAKKLGFGNYMKQPTVFSDAHHEGTPLTERQRGIIESHEAGHGIRQFLGDDAKEIRAVIDPDKVPADLRRYLSNPDEIAERMAQLKNYFGMSATDDFTRKHLDYAREHYVKDIGLDNDMDVFMQAIPEDRMEKFVELMNVLPL